MDEDISFQSKKRDAKKGRRAAKQEQTESDFRANGDIDGDEPADSITIQSVSPGPPVKPTRRQGGWADETSKSKSSRLRPSSPHNQDDSDDDMPVIPNLDEVQEEDLAAQIAAPPSIQVNRVATYKELDNDLLKHSQLLTLDNDIDLKLLTKVLSAESEVTEEDKPWDWDRLFTEVSSDLQNEWDKENQLN